MKPEKKQFLLGSKKPGKAVEGPEKAEEEKETDEQKYVAALKAAKKGFDKPGICSGQKQFPPQADGSKEARDGFKCTA